ncbi:MAG: helix-turn-helix domain-containing protein [Nanoarchaeota archaeon]|nr:helix-turn-helix domain-containing protein [Nanoarchaeota archaeon]
MKQNLLEEISLVLLKEGFMLKNVKGCFDLLARKEEKIILIKAIEDANSLNQESVGEMKKISSCVDATPLILTEKSGNKLENNIVYSRYGVFTINITTFQNALRQKLPFVKSGKAGLTASIDGKKLRDKREDGGMSLKELSRKIGVSKRMITDYENYNSEIMLKNAWKLYDIFGTEVFKQVNIFSEMDKIVYSCMSEVGKKYNQLGFKAVETKKNVFDIVAKKEKDIILTTVGDKFNQEINSLSRLLDAESLIVFEKKKPKTEIPKIAKKEFLELENEKELLDFF